jgi:hypothetical protein
MTIQRAIKFIDAASLRLEDLSADTLPGAGDVVARLLACSDRLYRLDAFTPDDHRRALTSALVSMIEEQFVKFIREASFPDDVKKSILADVAADVAKALSTEDVADVLVSPANPDRPLAGQDEPKRETSPLTDTPVETTKTT